MHDINLSKVERLILANQYEILGELRQEEYYSRLAVSLREGHKWLYMKIFDSVSDDLSDADREHVFAILGIYGDMRDSYKELQDKSGIDEHELNFLGFDGNNEVELCSFTDALFENGHFTNTIGRLRKNSHSPTTQIYRRMIQCWQELGKPNYPYSREQITAILGS
ncbi:MAG: YfbU family protein [Proteobacteria bacterium]|nr:YfbU family protein [Pseudomonadota bacterium]